MLLKAGNLEREGKAKSPAKAMPAAPITHNCYFASGPASSILYDFLQRYQSNQIPGVPGFGLTSSGHFWSK